MRKLILVVIILSISLLSCIKADDIEIGGVKRMDVESLSKVNLIFDIANKSGRKLTLKEMKINLVNSSGSDIMQVVLQDPVVIARRSHSDVSIPLRINIQNILAVAMLANNPKPTEGMVIKGYFVVKAGWLGSKRMEIDMPVTEDLFRQMGLKNFNINGLDKFLNIF